jgi:hypothetical protein
MGRIRTIKPEFFAHEELFDLEQSESLPLRLAFAGLWTVCDRDGRFVWRPRTLKSQVMPHDIIDFGEVLDALERGGFVQSYMVDGIKFGCVPSWRKHQVINTREACSKIPPLDEDSTGNVQARARTCHDIQYRGVNIADTLRETILARDEYKCCRCGATEDMTVDHIFPRSIGGNHAPANLRAMCRKCNSARPVAGKALIEDLGKDGFTLDDMQRTCTHMPSNVQAQGEGKGREMEEERKGTGKEQEGERGRSDEASPLVSDSPKRTRRPSVAIDRPDDIAEAHWRDWTACRRKPVTESVLVRIRREAAKAGITADEAIRTAAERQWEGFQAEWLNSDRQLTTERKPSQPKTFTQIREERTKDVFRKFHESGQFDAIVNAVRGVDAESPDRTDGGDATSLHPRIG